MFSKLQAELLMYTYCGKRCPHAGRCDEEKGCDYHKKIMAKLTAYPKYEYKMVMIQIGGVNSDTNKILNEAGADGWYLTQTETLFPTRYMYFIREKIGD